MFERIISISQNKAVIKINGVDDNLINLYLVIESTKRIVAQVESISGDEIIVNFLGEIINDSFQSGISLKPNMNSKIRKISREEFLLITNEQTERTILLGSSPIYNNFPIYADTNDLFSNHLSILGNTGSGKSCGVARILQNVFISQTPQKSCFFIFDAYGEYHNAFKEINKINPNYEFKYYTTELSDKRNTLKIPVYLLTVDDIALLLNATNHTQLMIIEKMMKLARIFSKGDVAIKNHLIANAIMAILYSNQNCQAKRDEVFSLLATCSTEQFQLESNIQGIGYTRTLKECFAIDSQGQFPESNILTMYINSFIRDDLDLLEVNENVFYNLPDLKKALDFTMISEGLFRNNDIYSDAIILKVRLHSLSISKSATFFDYPDLVDAQDYITSLVFKESKRCQIINFNLEDIDDHLAKTIVKIMSRMLFDFEKKLPNRATIPFHLFLEEAHRYVQEDSDKFLLGYNIFERIAKEGRKYGLIINLISQRPSEISDTVISQISNFVIFKITHPADCEYINKMLPNISEQIVEAQKNLKSGTCIAFGKAFKIPMIIKMELPNPLPSSSNSDVYANWK